MSKDQAKAPAEPDQEPRSGTRINLDKGSDIDLAAELSKAERGAASTEIRAKCDAKKNDAGIRMAETEEENKEKLYISLGIDKRGQRADSMSSLYGGFVNLVYLMVLVGCEIDLYGFAMAFNSYWAADVLVLRILLVVMPIAYFLAVAMYMYFAEDVKKRLAEQQKQQQPVGENQYLRSKDESKAPERPPLSTSYAQRPQTPINLQIYHFFPILRYYLVVKEKERTDIEGLFRVNSLSSFTLGIAQMVGIIFTQVVLNQDMNIFIKINCGSQAFNWMITFAYFLTSISASMAGQLEVETLNKNTDNELRIRYKEYLAIMDQCAQKKRPIDDVRDYEKTIDEAIYLMSARDENVLGLGTMKIREKFAALRLLHRKQNLEFARIGT